MSDLGGFDEWFGGKDWRLVERHESSFGFQYESTSGTWVDIGDQIVPGSLEIKWAEPADLFDDSRIREILRDELNKQWRRLLGEDDGPS